LVRRDNIRLAFATMVIALLLATPILGFNAIAVSDQLARLRSGAVAVDKFDWAALAFDFGDPGRNALDRLSRSRNSAIAKRAGEVAKAQRRWDVLDPTEAAPSPASLPLSRLRVLPKTVDVPADLLRALALPVACDSSDTDLNKCTLLYTPDATEAFAMQQGCFVNQDESSSFGATANCRITRMAVVDGKWTAVEKPERPVVPAKVYQAIRDGYKQGRVDVREVKRRQLFVGGVPVGEAFE
jgi:hypothetical protein